jgi:hypothetical protein
LRDLLFDLSGSFASSSFVVVTHTVLVDDCEHGTAAGDEGIELVDLAQVSQQVANTPHWDGANVRFE